MSDCWLFMNARGESAGLGHQRRCDALRRFAPPNVVEYTSDLSDVADPERIAVWGPLLREHDFSWVVLDGYHFTSDDQRAIQATGRQLLVIDDNHHLPSYHADLILNPNIGADRIIYRGSPLGRRLLGHDFALVANDILDVRQTNRRQSRIATEVLVTTGGGNPLGSRELIIDALSQVASERLNVTVIVGPNDADSEVELPTKSPHRWSITRNPTNLADLMNRADLAISTAGVTLTELAHLGVPTIAVIAADNQEPGAQAFAKAGTVELAGRVGQLRPDKLSNAIDRLIGDATGRTRLSENGQRLIDGQGAMRVRRAIQDLTIWMRPATVNDTSLLLDWANDPDARHASFHSEEISSATHERWFAERLRDPNCTIYIADHYQETPLGQVRFQREGAEATISASVATNHRGKHRGTRMIHLACRRYFHEHEVNSIVALIKPNNEASLRVFQRVGFKFMQETEVNGQRATEWSMARNGWS